MILTIALILFLSLLIIEDIRHHTIALYNLVGVFLCGAGLGFFSLWGGVVGLFILLFLGLYIRLFLKKSIHNTVGEGDIVLLSLIFFMLQPEQIPLFLFLSGVFGGGFYFTFRKQYVPLGSGIGAAYVSIILNM